MGIDAWLTAAIISVMLAVLCHGRTPPDIAFMGALVVLLVSGILNPAQAFSGFANQGMITVGALYVVIAGLRDTGGVQWLVHRLLGRPLSLIHPRDAGRSQRTAGRTHH